MTDSFSVWQTLTDECEPVCKGVSALEAVKAGDQCTHKGAKRVIITFDRNDQILYEWREGQTTWKRLR